ncbi:hypothetical protein [Streptomyces chattanoogensis]|uniref:Uncharacterized protein n=1 Tax=Streptomyces chattanoogensis TaxID=66876 RepID=A0A0N0XVR1_9ACTN|nr:hypothetical protein [Streptomyces chattanoogensis]AJT66490.1 hypothetical protein T261_4852 [Streptomyces lydicus]KPC63195.1 hypothetical protein ADL29_15900 [Streptomyces chattanoogensis]
MLPSVSILQQVILAVLLVATAAWAVALVRLLRRARHRAAGGRGRRPLLGSVPRQTGPGGPPSECVELTAAEREAFAGLVRQLTNRG